MTGSTVQRILNNPYLSRLITTRADVKEQQQTQCNTSELALVDVSPTNKLEIISTPDLRDTLKSAIKRDKQ